jgi:hypothetical protein
VSYRNSNLLQRFRVHRLPPGTPQKFDRLSVLASCFCPRLFYLSVCFLFYIQQNAHPITAKKS